jgi:hypothetical protein
MLPPRFKTVYRLTNSTPNALGSQSMGSAPPIFSRPEHRAAAPLLLERRRDFEDRILPRQG